MMEDSFISPHSLKKVVFAVDVTIPSEAFVVQLHLAVGALETTGVPGSFQHLEDEPVQDRLLAPGTLWNAC